MEFPIAPGFGFYPSEEDMLRYLRERVLQHIQGDPNSIENFFPDIDLLEFSPWDLPTYIESLTAGNPNRRHEWYFFSPRPITHGHTGTKRKVKDVGEWKVTGKGQDVVCGSTGIVIGKKKIVTFRQSQGCSSNHGNGSWVMHEYHLSPSYLGNENNTEMTFVACSLKNKAGAGSSGR